MDISEWLDKQEAEGADLTQIAVPQNLSYDDRPDETVYFEEINPCGLFCTGNHPFSTVERFGNWYYARGQDKRVGIHSEDGKWHLFTKDRDAAVKTAKSHLQ